MARRLAVFAEFEHEILRERVRAGLAHAREDGRLLARCSWGGWYLSAGFDWRRPRRGLLRAAVRYAAYSAFVLGGLAGGLRRGVIFLEAAASRKPSRAETALPRGHSPRYPGPE